MTHYSKTGFKMCHFSFTSTCVIQKLNFLIAALCTLTFVSLVGEFAVAADETCSTSCSAGFYNTSASLSSCTSCPAGYYCTGGGSAPVACGYGSYATGGATACTTCSGTACTYNTGTAAAASCVSNGVGIYYDTSAGGKRCVACSASLYNNRTTLATACLAIPTGYWRVDAATVAICYPGYSCSAGVQAACASGRYASAYGATTCTLCTAGYACAATGQVKCQPGTYALAGATSCTLCPAGYYCQSTTTATSTACPAGTFSVGGQANCTACPTGMACTSTGTVSSCAAGKTPSGTTCIDCPVGYACPSGVAVACANGTYAATAGSTTCTPCPSGYRCPLTTAAGTACGAGFYAAGSATACTACTYQRNVSYYTTSTTASACILCPAGSSCATAANSPAACAAGTYSIGGAFACSACSLGTSAAASGSSACTSCPAGSYCPNPAGAPIACAAGTYSTGGQWNCTICPAGTQCANASGTPIACGSGTYSVAGSTQCQLCPVNYACPTPSSTPQACDNVTGGFYAPIGSTSCQYCAPGMACTVGTNGNVTITPCPAGTYRATYSLSCTMCPAGYQCADPAAPPVRCVNGTYSLTGATTCIQCPAGYACANFSGPTVCPLGFFSALADANCTKCWPGFSCLEPWNGPAKCPDGSYAAEGSVNCTICPRGWACPSSRDPTQAYACASGTYSTGGKMECTQCAAGFYCPSVYDDIQLACPAGYYSMRNSRACTKCAAGYQCPSTSYDVLPPVPCIAGWYSVGGQQKCTACPMGFRCPDTTTATIIACPNGTWTTEGMPSCTMCPAGYYCPQTAVYVVQPLFGPVGVGRQVPCAPGTYSVNGSWYCTKCPTGFACPNASLSDGGRTACPAGQYPAVGSEFVSIGASNCAPCPAGGDCSSSSLGVAPSTCASGTYATTAGCVSCPAGSYCSSPDSVPIPCAAGQWSAIGSVQCSTCKGGYVCPVSSTTSTPPASQCPIGYYCPPGTTTALPCPAGTYGVTVGAATQATGCTSCAAGVYCPAGTASGSQQTCPLGYYCPPGTSFPVPCPVGTYSDTAGATSRATCRVCPEGYYCPVATSNAVANLCPAGHYCPAGTGAGYDNACPAGTFGTDMQMASVMDCQQCPIGSSCPSSGLTANVLCPPGTYQPLPGQVSCLACEAGWACPRSGMFTYMTTPCEPGYYCPRGTALAKSNPCPGGTYTFRKNLADVGECEICWRGYYCPSGTGDAPAVPQPCAVGSYCPGVPQDASSQGTYYYLASYGGKSASASNQFRCPQGSFSTTGGLWAAEQCTPCYPGSYCLGGGSAVSGACAAGSFCPVGSYLPDQVPCAPGTWNPNTGGTSQSDCRACVPGYFCPAGSWRMQACPQGTYSPFNRTMGPGPAANLSDGQCIRCPSGYYCPSAATSPLRCSTGTYAPAGVGSCITCESGRYCPQNATTEVLKESVFLCPAGLYCPSAMSRLPSVDYDLCPSGFYCPVGVASPIACPPGTINPARGRMSITDCQLCPAGYYCSGTAATNVTGLCSPGYFCPLGSTSATQEPCPAKYYRSTSGAESADFCAPCPQGAYCPLGTSSAVTCPQGYYCPSGSAMPTPCPIGTYGNSTGLVDQADCSSCTPGYYCDGLGLAYPTGLCDPGYYCAGRAFSSAPPGLPTGGLCPKGGYCPPGSAYPTACAEGTFNNETGGSTQQDCTTCTPGYYCSGSNLPYPSGPCAAGYYCTGGASTPTQFASPPGSYSLPGASSPTQCAIGTYNPVSAQGSCIACVKGNYCPAVGLVSYIMCPAGSYCPASSVTPTACPIGMFQPVLGQSNFSNCISCLPGRYCAEANISAVTGWCAAGYYCKRGCINAQCGEYTVAGVLTNNLPANPGIENPWGGSCPYGAFCPNGTSFPLACAIGTTRDALQGTENRSCTPCAPGYYCPTTGMSFLLSGSKLPTPCQAGFYCPGTIPGTDVGCSDAMCTAYHSEYCDLNLNGCDGIANMDLVNATPGPRLCPTGFYCPVGSIRPTRCGISSDGKTTWAPRRGQTWCQICPAGFYCDMNNVTTLQVAQDCPAGRYCPAGTGALQPMCPVGSWSDRLNLVNRSNCFLCPAGRYCPKPGTTAITVADVPFCFGGYYCTAGAYDGFGHYSVNGGIGGICPLGYYCPNATKFNTSYPCPPGTYKPRLGGSSVTSCLACDAGKYCEGTALSAVSGGCQAGFYCPRSCSDQHCTNQACGAGILPFVASTKGGPCPSGSYCPAQSAAPTPCALGMYQPYPMQSRCVQCPAGYYCGTGFSTPAVCPRGHYCPAATTSVNIPRCPPGTYVNVLGSVNVTNCNLCPAGVYCPEYSMNASFIPCNPGFYCTAGAINGHGVVGTRGGLGGKCPAGHYCPRGTMYSNSYPCPNGTYNPNMGSTNLTACSACTPGYVCENTGNSAPTAPCAAGYYCPRGCADVTCSNRGFGSNCAAPSLDGGACPPGSYCPQSVMGFSTIGARNPIVCAPGTYTPGYAYSSCLPCPAGSWCLTNTSIPEECPAGYYCPQGTRFATQYPCPNGTMSTSTGLTNMTSCALCPAGHYCAVQAMTNASGECAPGYYCGSGAAASDGALGILGGVSGVCAGGHFCPSGSVVPTEVACPTGTYNPFTRVGNETGCIACSPGMHCNATGLLFPSGKCTAGYFCPRGCSDDTCSNMPCSSNCADYANAPYTNGGLCPAGYICPVTSDRGAVVPIACDAGTHAPSQGMSACIVCPAGYFCGPATSIPTLCPAGRYCPTSTNLTQPSCPAGSYRGNTGGSAVGDCVLCDAGRYCANQGNTSFTGDCLPGYWCTSGARNGTGVVGVLGGSAGGCPTGHYCPAATTVPREFPCPIGTYNPDVFSTNISACLPCRAGYYCAATGMSNVSGPCADGYVCRGGCEDERCSNECTTNCSVGGSGACPIGYYCPQKTVSGSVATLVGPTTTSGAVVPTPCPAGTYAPVEGSFSCLPCPAGHTCDIAGQPVPCPVGFVCPVGTGPLNATACPAGSYSNQSGLVQVSQCLLCPPGDYCGAPGLSQPSGPCGAGFFCPGGAASEFGASGVLGIVVTAWPLVGGFQVCPNGYFCPAGSSMPTPCPAGSYNPVSGGANETSACLLCAAGRYCSLPNATATTGDCAAGYACPTGCVDPYCAVSIGSSTNVSGLCPAGTYCPVGSASPLPCAAGYWSAAGSASCGLCPAGNYCPANGASPIPCPAGMYCPAGSNGVSIPKCPAGTFSNVTGLAARSECQLCSVGHACAASGLTQPDGVCSPGFLCYSGALNVTGGLGVNGGSSAICSPGHYCPAGTPIEIPCSAGTYGPLAQAGDASECLSCIEGSYCDVPGLAAPFALCSAGYICGNGSTTPTPVLSPCPVGHYCPAGATAATACPAGTMNPSLAGASVADCLQCPAGYYCLTGAANVSGRCNGGYYCVAGSPVARPSWALCPAGTFCPVGSAAPQECPGGRYCASAGLSAPTGGCLAGYYCSGGSNVSTPINETFGDVCPVGHYCPRNTTIPLACPAGTFNPNVLQPSPLSCFPCPGGMYCPDAGASAATQFCNAGWYCPPGQSVASPPDYLCPVGYYCPAASSAPRRCAAGTFTNTSGRSTCSTCPASYYCSQKDLCPTTNVTTPEACPLGYYCPSGTRFATEFPCPVGRYSNVTGLSAASQCLACPAGRYCPLPATVDPAALCSAGYYCASGAATATPTDNVTGGVCPRGSYCPAGSPAATPCPPATFNGNYGMSSLSQCLACTAGMYCAGSGNVQPTGQCSAGYYCPTGSAASNAVECTWGAACPTGSAFPSRCPSGSFASNVSQSSCRVCTAGFYCDETKPCVSTSGNGLLNYTCPVSCPEGYFCPAGTTYAVQHPCPAGRYGATIELTSVSACLACPTGMYCAAPGTTAAATVPCAAGYFCRNSSKTATPTDGVSGMRCPAGYYCPQGTTVLMPCPAGTYSAQVGASNISTCQICTAGYACTLATLTAPNMECQAGFYCPEGQVVPNPAAYECPIGMYCPIRSAAPLVCPSGTTTLAPGAASCDVCPAGYYCTQEWAVPGDNVSEPVLCPIGYYCPAGTSLEFQFPCPPGTYSLSRGNRARGNCTLCPTGKGCPNYGMTTNLPDCNAGYYCISGANSTVPTDNVTGGLCPAGSYCPTGVTAPIACPLGTFSAAPGLSNSSQCQLCTPGRYCNGGGLTSPTGPCAAGYYCPRNASTPAPVEFICPGYKYCPEGSASPVDCPPGTYALGSDVGLAVCRSCPAGMWCNLDLQVLAPYNLSGDYTQPIICPGGYYCPNGTQLPNANPCPRGTFGNTTGMTNVDECILCSTGHYCATPGMNYPTGLCYAGYYCTLGSNTSEPDLPAIPSSIGGPCPSGRYCLAGTTGGMGTPCPAGTFYGGRYGRNITACQPCAPGYYCLNPGSTVGTGDGPCSPGFYCPGGDNLPSRPEQICPTGTYCPGATPAPIPCPGGTYNPTPGNASCMECPEFFFCPRGTSFPYRCYDRHVCPAGSAYPLICPNGTYALASVAAMNSFSQCALCPSGKYCTNGTVTGNCAGGYYCEYGNSQPDPDSATDLIGVKKGGICPIGSYCPEGTTVRLPCTNGTVGYTTGLQRASDCQSCTAGYYCLDTSITPIPCPRGYYCPGNLGSGSIVTACPRGTYQPQLLATDLSWCLSCKAGYYCPLPAMVSTTTFATPPGFYSATSQESPYPCPAGTYQPKSNGSAANTTACITCPIGHYCGPQSMGFNLTCPEGTYCPLGSAYPFHCPGGMYCPRGTDAPITCPEGYYCAALSTFPSLCWNGTYCPTGSEAPQLCPAGTISRNDTAVRISLADSCQTCPAGTWSSNTLFCEPCSAGYVCLGGTTVGTPTDIETQRGYICPVGYYCPTGSSAPTPCPPGRFNNRTGGRTISACLLCDTGFYNPDYAQTGCKRCGSSATSSQGSAECDCKGAYRSFQPTDGSCRCIPSYVFYTEGHELSEEDSPLACQPIVYPRCVQGQFRSASGACVESRSTVVCSMCESGQGVVDPQLGVCSCDVLQSEDEICDEKCRSQANQLSLDTDAYALKLYSPTSGRELSIDLSSAAMLGTKTCGLGKTSCRVRAMSMTSDGIHGIYNPAPSTFLKAATGNYTTTYTTAESTQRQLMNLQGTDVTDDNERTITNPIVCLNLGESMLWDVSDPSREHYPVYVKDSLLNTNPNFDYTAFRELADKIRAPNLTLTTFVFPFTTAGMYVIADNANSEMITIIRVVTANEVCPDTTFMAVTESSTVSMSVTRNQGIILEPDWLLIGTLCGALLVLLAVIVAGLWHFRRQAWGMLGSSQPRYRNLGLELLSGKAATLASKGTHLRKTQLLANGEERLPAPPGSSLPITLRLDAPFVDFDPKVFIEKIAKDMGVADEYILVLSSTEGSTIVRFVVTGAENAQELASDFVARLRDANSAIHQELPILAYDAPLPGEALGMTQEAANAHGRQTVSLSSLEDEFWDYERQIDLEGFNVRTLYDKLEDQTVHLVAQLANQRDDLLLLCDKILVESEALKEMFLKIKLDIDDRNRGERNLQKVKEEKLQSGKIEFDLPEDLKMTLSAFLNGFFDRWLAGMGGSSVINRTDVYDETQVVHVEIDDETGAPVRPDHRVQRGRGAGGAGGAFRPGTAEDAELDDLRNVETLKGISFDAQDDGKDVGPTSRFASKTVVDACEFARDLRDDSDLEDDERMERAEARERTLRRKLARARRAMDHAIMPAAFHALDVPGAVPPEKVAQLTRERDAWLEQRRQERAAADEIPMDMKDDTSMGPEQRLALGARRQVQLFKRLRDLRDSLATLDVPPTLWDDETLPTNEREARAEKRAQYLEQKVAKARRVRAEATVPMDMQENSDLDQDEQTRRRTLAEEAAGVLHAKSATGPAMPSALDPHISAHERRERERFADQVLARRALGAQSQLQQLELPEGASDRSDVDEKEARERRAKRAALGFRAAAPSALPFGAAELEARAAARGAAAGAAGSAAGAAALGGAAGASTVQAGGGLSAGPGFGSDGAASGRVTAGGSSTLADAKRVLAALNAKGGAAIPEEFRDDPDCDPAERKMRAELRRCFVAGRSSKGLNAAPLEEEEDVPSAGGSGGVDRTGGARGRTVPGAAGAEPVEITATERKMRELRAAAFRRGQAAKYGANVEELEEARRDIESVLAAASSVPELQRAVDAGKQVDAAVEMPDEFKGASTKQRALRQAFTVGRRVAAVSEVPPELDEQVDGLSGDEQRTREELHAQFETARSQAGASVFLPSEMQGDAHLQRAFALGRDVERGRAVADLIELEGDRERVALMTAAYSRGRTAARALALPNELAADPACRAAFAAAVAGATALPESLGGEHAPPAVRAAFERGVAQRASIESMVPPELRDDVPLLSDDEIRVRRQLQALFKVGLRAAVAEQVLREMTDAPDAPGATPEEKARAQAARDAFKAAHEAGYKAQKAADALPKEITDAIAAAAAEGDEAKRAQAEKQRAAWIRGRTAAHMAAALIEDVDPQGVTELGMSESDRKELRQAIRRGQAAQAKFSEVPSEMKDAESLSLSERERRAKLRAAFNAGRNARTATRAVEELEEAQHDVDAVAAAAGAPAASGRSATAAGAAASADGSASGAGGKASAVPDADLAAQMERQLKRMKVEHRSGLKQLQQKQAGELSAMLEELEEEKIADAKKLDFDMREQFALEQMRLKQRHAEALNNVDAAARPGLQATQAKELQLLEEAQAAIAKEAQDALMALADDKAARKTEQLREKAMNELRLQKTIQNDQQAELKRLQEQAANDSQFAKALRENDLEAQKRVLMEKLNARERRMKVKLMKEKEFLESQLASNASIERDVLEAEFANRRTRAIKQVEAMAARGGLSAADAAAEIERIQRTLEQEHNDRLQGLQTTLQAERIEKERELAERQAADKERELKVMQEEVDALLLKGRQAAIAAESAMSPEASAAVALMLQQEEQRKNMQQTLQQQREEDTRLLAQEDAAREIARIEAEKGQQLTERQKKEIHEECLRNAARLNAAVSDEQFRQQDAARKRLEQARRRREQDLQRKQTEEVRRELSRHEQDAAQREAAVRAAVTVVQVDGAEEAKAEEQELEQRRLATIEELKRRQEQERLAFEANLEQDLQRQQDESLARIKAEHERKLQELQSEQAARESVKLDEKQRAIIMEQHEADRANLNRQIEREAAAQRDRVKAQLEARAAKRRADLERKQREERDSTIRRGEDEQAKYVREIKVEQERKTIEATARRAHADQDKMQDIARVVMADRHRLEAAQLITAGTRRREAIEADLAAKQAAKREALQQQIGDEVEKECMEVPMLDPQREAKVAAIRSAGAERMQRAIADLADDMEGDREAAFVELNAQLAQEQLALHLRHLNEVSEACGTAQPGQVIARYQATAQQAASESEKELLAFKQQKAKEQDAMRERLEADKREYEEKLQAEMEKQKREQDEQLERKRHAMQEQLQADRLRREKELRDAKLEQGGATAAADSAAFREALIQKSREEEERLLRARDAERARQESELQARVRARMQRNAKRQTAAASPVAELQQALDHVTIVPPVATLGAAAAAGGAAGAAPSETQPTPQRHVVTAAASTPQRGPMPMMAAMAAMQGPGTGPVNPQAVQQWAQSVVLQLQQSPLFEKVCHIERMLQAQQHLGLLNFYLDTKDRERPSNEGQLVEMDPLDLPAHQYIVWFYGSVTRDRIARSGVPLPQLRLAVASSLPTAAAAMSAFRHSYWYDTASQTLYIRNARLESLGEFQIVLLHALAHIKAADGQANAASWNDADVRFLADFYGLLEVAAEEAFFARLPDARAQRDAVSERQYRPDAIMSRQSLAEVEAGLRGVSRGDREAFLRRHFML